MRSERQKLLCRIANAACDAVSELLDRDQRQAQALRSAGSTSRQLFREETITETMVAAVQGRFSDHLEIDLFTPAEEAKNGADWYWQIRTPEGSIHARVQAKRIRRRSFGQPDDEAQVELDRNQLQRLIDQTASDRTRLPGLEAWTAIYARLDASPPCGNMPSQCSLHGCEETCAGWGTPSIWIADAQGIQSGLNPNRSSFSMSEMVPHAIRLDCFLPCLQGQSRVLEGPAVKGFGLQEGIPTFRTCVAAISSSDRMRRYYKGALLIKV